MSRFVASCVMACVSMVGLAASAEEPCPGGQVVTEYTYGHCCWPGQGWNGKRCTGTPQCPEGLVVEGRTCRDASGAEVATGGARSEGGDASSSATTTTTKSTEPTIDETNAWLLDKLSTYAASHGYNYDGTTRCDSERTEFTSQTTASYRYRLLDACTLEISVSSYASWTYEVGGYGVEPYYDSESVSNEAVIKAEVGRLDPTGILFEAQLVGQLEAPPSGCTNSGSASYSGGVFPVWITGPVAVTQTSTSPTVAFGNGGIRLYFSDQEMAKRAGEAFAHAIELCREQSTAEPF